ncbi:hypothetical protein FACS1894204_12650 [Synergistales bacterium]|nr:hypothetical protein FACS1894204_12650 [Synergistales bacterium]
MKRDEAIKIAMSIKEEDIDLSDMPEMGGVTNWRNGEDRVTFRNHSPKIRQNTKPPSLQISSVRERKEAVLGA